MIEIIKSETWLTDTLRNAQSALDTAISDFVDDEHDRVINIQKVKEDSGLLHLLIFVEKNVR